MPSPIKRRSDLIDFREVSSEPAKDNEKIENKEEGRSLFTSKVVQLLHYEEVFRAVVETALSVDEIVVSLFERVAENAEKVGHVLEQILNGAYIFSFAKDIKWWITGKSHSIYETISKVFLTTVKGIKSTLFISSLGAFSLSKIAVTIGRIPVIGMVVNVLVLGGYGTHLIKDIKEYSRISDDLKLLQKKLEDCINAGNTELGGENSKVTAIKNEIKAKKILLHGVKVEVITGIVSIAFSILTIMAFCTGWGALVMSSALMISLSVTSSAMWLYSCYYGEKHKAVEDKPVDNPYSFQFAS